jgi:hypothetical protein
MSTIDTDRASIMSAKFYNGGRSLGDLIRSLIESDLSLPEVGARLVSQINVNEIVVEPDLPKGSRPELMSRDRVMIIAVGNDTLVDADSFRHHPLTRALLDRFAPSPSHAARSDMACLGINLPVIEKVLNYSSGSFAGIVDVDQRHGSADEKRYALERCAAHVADLVSGRRSSNVVRLETRA